MHRASDVGQNHLRLILQKEGAILFSLRIHHLLVDLRMHYSPVSSIRFVVRFPEKSLSCDPTVCFDLVITLIV